MKPNPLALLAALAAASLTAACGDRLDSPPPSSTVVPAPASAPPPASPAPVAVPPASSQTPPDTATAKDSRANDPSGPLTKEQESSAMPKAGQANNHSSPSFEKDKKP